MEKNWKVSFFRNMTIELLAAIFVHVIVMIYSGGESISPPVKNRSQEIQQQEISRQPGNLYFILIVVERDRK